MLKKIAGLIFFLAIGYGGYLWFVRFEVHKMPTVSDDQWTLLVGGLKGLMVAVEDQRPERKYLFWPATDIPEWYQNAWAVCRLSSNEERQAFAQAVDLGPGGRS